MNADPTLSLEAQRAVRAIEQGPRPCADCLVLYCERCSEGPCTCNHGRSFANLAKPAETCLTCGQAPEDGGWEWHEGGKVIGVYCGPECRPSAPVEWISECPLCHTPFQTLPVGHRSECDGKPVVLVPFVPEGGAP